jgi:predicted dehydrogenase
MSAGAKRPAGEFDDAEKLIRELRGEIDAVSIALPNHLHAPLAVAALKAGKAVLIEKPPARDAREARKIAAAADKAGRPVLYAFQRRFGGAEQAARAALAKGYAGQAYHVRAAWLRTRGVPVGTGWFTRREQSGGGAVIDIGIHLLDLAWWLLGQPRPVSVYAATHARLAPEPTEAPVEDLGVALLRFDGGATVELSASWALNQPPHQQGTLCRVFGDGGCIDVYTPTGPQLYRQFDDQGNARPTALKPPRLVGHAALMRHFRECILGKSQPSVGPAGGVTLMEMVAAIYRSAESGRSVAL